MFAEAQAAIRHVRTRSWIAVALVTFARTLAVLALAGGTALLVARGFGRNWRPEAWWAAGLAIPAAAAILRANRRVPSHAAAALYVDRELGLGGLVVSDLEVSGDAWRETLRARLAGAAPLRLRMEIGRPVFHGLLAIAFLALVALLPAVRPRSPTVSPAIVDALASLAKSLADPAVADAITPEMIDALKKQLESLQKQVASGESPSWTDVDALEKRVEQAVEEHKQAAEEALAALSEAMEGAAGADLREGLTRFLENAAKQGLTQKLPAELLKRMNGGAGKAGDFGNLPVDPAELAKLADELAKQFGGNAADLAKLGLGDPARARKAGEASRRELALSKHVHDESCRDGH